MPSWTCFVLALAAGLASGVQGPANGALARAVGLPRAVALNGAVVCLGTLLGVLFFSRGAQSFRFDQPWTHYIGGFCGLTVIVVAAAAVPRIGAADYTVALVLGMVVASVLVDALGLYGQPTIPLSPLRLLAIGFIITGVAIIRFTRIEA